MTLLLSSTHQQLRLLSANRIAWNSDWLSAQPIGSPQQIWRLSLRYSPVATVSFRRSELGDADAEAPCRSVASSDLNVCRNAVLPAVLSEAAALRWPMSGSCLVHSGAAAGGSSRRRRLGDHQHELEAVHLRRDGLDCRRIRYVMHQKTQTLTSMYVSGGILHCKNWFLSCKLIFVWLFFKILVKFAAVRKLLQPLLSGAFKRELMHAAELIIKLSGADSRNYSATEDVHSWSQKFKTTQPLSEFLFIYCFHEGPLSCLLFLCWWKLGAIFKKWGGPRNRPGRKATPGQVLVLFHKTPTHGYVSQHLHLVSEGSEGPLDRTFLVTRLFFSAGES